MDTAMERLKSDWWKCTLLLISFSSNPGEFNEGLEQGWSIGFNDGTWEGVRIVFADAKKKGIDLLSKPIDDYLTKKYRFSSIKHIIQKKNFQGFENIEKSLQFKAVFDEFAKINDSKVTLLTLNLYRK